MKRFMLKRINIKICISSEIKYEQFNHKEYFSRFKAKKAGHTFFFSLILD